MADEFRRMLLLYRRSHRRFRILTSIMAAGLICTADPVSAQLIDDFMFRITNLSITQVELAGQTHKPDFTRQKVEFGVGVGPAMLGMIYQHTSKGPRTVPGRPDDGLMITGGYNHMIHPRISLDVYGRIGILSRTPRSDPLYSTDTDIRTKLVFSHPDGKGFLFGKPLFPSAYAGFILNQYGRFQGVVGTGVWWRGAGLYLTVFRAVNGVSDPANPGKHGDVKHAHLKNGGVNLIASYEFSDLMVEIKKNHPLRNGGNDLSVVLQYRYFFKTREE